MKKIEVVIIGLGYIGLPTAALIASNKINVLGVDINKNVVNTINKGEIHIVEPDLDKAVSDAVKNDYLRASENAIIANTYIIVVPTPFKENKEPDISYIESATLSIIPILKQDDLYIIESTSPIKTSEKMRDLIYKNRPDLKDKINIAYCPERVLPGNVMYELVHNDRVIGGIDLKSTKKAVEFYSKFVKGKLHETDSRTAEMCKLVENASRDNQIAFANELSLICDKADIDVWKLINLANKHPRVNILQPGCGVGGHCIAVDPYFIISDFKDQANLIEKSRTINNYKPDWCVHKIEDARKNFINNNGKNPKIAVMGLAFKPDIDDLRESPACYIANKIKEKFNKNDLFFVEPNIKNHKNFRIDNFLDAYNNSDIIALLVSHKEFITLPFTDEKLILDFCGVKSKNDC